MSALEVVLLTIASWTALSVVVVLMVQPLLRLARLADLPASAPTEAAPVREPEHRPASRVRESGYCAIVLERLVLHASTVFAADQVCIFGRDTRARDDGLVLVQGAGVNPDLIGSPLDVEWDPMVAALACGRPLAVSGHLWPAWELGHDAAEVHSAAIAPVWFGGRIQGAVSVTHRRDGGLDVDGLGRLGDVAELVGHALAHTVGRQLSVADPQPEIDGLLEALQRTDPESARLAAEVAGTAWLLADDLGIGGADLLELELGARLHGVGRLRMPAGGAGRSRAPGEADRDLLRLEPIWGAEMVARIPGLEAVALIVRHSRERWDGRGQPDGLAGETIPLASRIIAVSEALCSVTPGVVEELAGRSLDPDLAARAAGLARGLELHPTA
jgi:hypothetical protein